MTSDFDTEKMNVSLTTPVSLPSITKTDIAIINSYRINTLIIDMEKTDYIQANIDFLYIDPENPGIVKIMKNSINIGIPFINGSLTNFDIDAYKVYIKSLV